MIKTVREPLILLGAGAEGPVVAAAGKAVALEWGRAAVRLVRFSRQPRKLLVASRGSSSYNYRVFSLAVAANTRYIGVVFFIGSAL